MAATLDVTSIESRPESASARTCVFGLGGDGMDYRPGQYVTIQIEDVEDPRGPQRPFTMSSSPSERDHIQITFKTTGSPFKETLQEIADQGDAFKERLRIRGPLGKFTLDTERPALMIAGGIGITPFRSMIRYAVDRQAGSPITLLYSNGTPDDIAFRDELDAIAAGADWLTVIHTITRPDEAGPSWSGRTGRIDKKLIAEAAGRLEQPIYYVCGPPDMVAAMTGIIRDKLDVPESDLRSEKFTGY